MLTLVFFVLLGFRALHGHLLAWPLAPAVCLCFVISALTPGAKSWLLTLQIVSSGFIFCFLLIGLRLFFTKTFFFTFYFEMILDLYQSFTNSTENPEVLLPASPNVGILMAPAQLPSLECHLDNIVYWVPHRPFWSRTPWNIFVLCPSFDLYIDLDLSLGSECQFTALSICHCHSVLFC